MIPFNIHLFYSSSYTSFLQSTFFSSVLCSPYICSRPSMTLQLKSSELIALLHLNGHSEASEPTAHGPCPTTFLVPSLNETTKPWCHVIVIPSQWLRTQLSCYRDRQGSSMVINALINLSPPHAKDISKWSASGVSKVLFIKNQTVNILGFACHPVSVLTTQLWHFSMTTAIDNM